MSAYKDIKNHIHNTLAITKEEIRGMVETTVEKVVERKLEVMFRKYWDEDKPSCDYSLYTMERVIDHAIRNRAISFWGMSEDSFDDYVKRQVVRELLMGVRLKVEVAKNKQEATETGDMLVTVKKRRG